MTFYISTDFSLNKFKIHIYLILKYVFTIRNVNTQKVCNLKKNTDIF